MHFDLFIRPFCSHGPALLSSDECTSLKRKKRYRDIRDIKINDRNLIPAEKYRIVQIRTPKIGIEFFYVFNI